MVKQRYYYFQNYIQNPMNIVGLRLEMKGIDSDRVDQMSMEEMAIIDYILTEAEKQEKDKWQQD